MSTAIATRSELLARRLREGIAQRGHTLLRQKRAVLIAELRRVGLEVGEKRAELERIAAAAPRARLGGSRGWPARRGLSGDRGDQRGHASVSSRSVAGVPVIELHADRAGRASPERGYALMTSSATIERVAESLEAELDALLEIVAAEPNLRRLTAQVARTTRQVKCTDDICLSGRLPLAAHDVSSNELFPAPPQVAPHFLSNTASI
jgi:vacuolar-type H+-ATPase subunit D/Vma8